MSPPPPRQSSPEKHIAILDAALHCFMEKGFAGTRISDIADHAGVGKGTVYEYVPTKEELLLEACLHACRINQTRMNSIAQGVVISDPSNGGKVHNSGNLHPVKAAYEVLRSVLLVLLTQSAQENRLFTELVSVSSQRPHLQERTRQEFGRKLNEWMESAFAMGKAGMEAGYFNQIPDAKYRWCARIIVAAVDGLIWQRCLQVEDEHSAPEIMAAHIAAAWVRLHLTEPHRLEEYLS